MISRTSVKTPKRQQGLALLVLVIIFVLAFTSYIFSGLSIPQIKVDRDKNTQLNLKKAKQAIIDYVVTYADRSVANDYGVLPHPETYLNANDGNMASVGGTKNTNIVGWLPWRSLDMPNLKDDSGTCLFYAVSGTYKLGASVQADMINEDSIGMFRVRNSAGTIVQGENIEDRVVALVIAPGAPLLGQVRNPAVISSSCGRDYTDFSAYLEGNGVYDNSTVSAAADTIDDFIHATEASSTEATPYNDKFLTITRNEVWNAIVKRSDFKQDMETLTQALAMCLSGYANLSDNTGRRLPWPAKVNLGATLDYRDDANYDDDSAAEGYSGRYPFDVGSSNDAIDPTKLAEDSVFEITGLCNNLGTDWEGEIIDLENDSSKYRQLWNNWKDHFFYVLSKDFEPATAMASCGSGCITVNTVPMAGVVIYAGSRQVGVQIRNGTVAAGDVKTKDDIGNYIDDASNQAAFIASTGKGAYIATGVNDIMYCIKPDLEVAVC